MKEFEVLRWGERLCFQAPEFSVTGRKFNSEVRLSPEEAAEITKTLIKEFPSFRGRIRELVG